MKPHRPDGASKRWAQLTAHPRPVLAVPAVIPGEGDLHILSVGVSTAGSEPPIALAWGDPACARTARKCSVWGDEFLAPWCSKQLSFPSLAQCHHTEDGIGALLSSEDQQR